MNSARKCTVALIGCGRVGRTFLALVAGRAGVVEKRTGVQLRVTAIADSGALLAHEPGLTEPQIRVIAEAKTAGVALAEVEAPGLGPGSGAVERWSVRGPVAAQRLLAALPSGAPDIVVDLTDERCAELLVALRGAGSALVLGNKRPLIEDMATWHALTGPHDGLPPARWEATVASSLPVVKVVRELADSGDTPRLMTGALSGTLGVLLAHIAGGGTAVEGLARAVSVGLTEPDVRRDLDGIDTAAKALILARTAGWEAEIEDVVREPLMGVDWSAVPNEDVERELTRLGPPLSDRMARENNLRYLSSVSSNRIWVGVAEAPADLAALDPANSGLRIETDGFGAFPLLLSGRGGGSRAAAEAVLSDVVAIAAAKFGAA